MIYKIISQHALVTWKQSHTQQEQYLWYGEGIDIRDQYIHCSSKNQVARTLTIYFPKRTDLFLLTFDETDPELIVQWETSRDQQLFPHIYHGISWKYIKQQAQLLLDKNDQYILPW